MASSRFPVTAIEIVVEVVGDGPGHARQAFGLLELPLLGVEFLLFLGALGAFASR